MDQLLEILRDIRHEINWENETALIDDGVLDSFDMITLVNELNSAFRVQIGLEHLEPENFNSVGAMEALIEALKL